MNCSWSIWSRALARVGLAIVLSLFAGMLSGARAAVADDPAPDLSKLPPPLARKVDFARDVQPILARSCVLCHGPKGTKGGLALHEKARALTGGDSGPVIEVGKSAESLLIQYVGGLEPDHQMPPKGKAPALSRDEIALLRAWVDQGAAWPDGLSVVSTAVTGQSPSEHWSFRKPTRPALPSLNHPDWVKNPIDRFVLHRLEREGLSPSPEVDRLRLIRRVSLDLIGLPPSPEQADAFAADTRPDAYERLVDRLLESPHHGERWARWWLDRARYADTNGYEKDRERSIWPYRDWVIQALNADMPFDRFTIEQIAGDLLPDRTLSQQVATGFHRNTMTNEEGGIDVEEFRYASLVDRVATTGAVWLGLTLGCAQCHTHKYDPITQREYYQFMAFYNNADEPELIIPDPIIESKRKEIQGRIDRLESSLALRFPPEDWSRAVTVPTAWNFRIPVTAVAMGPDGKPLPIARRRELTLAARFDQWRTAKRAASARWITISPRNMTSKFRATMEQQSDGSILVSGDKPNNDVYELEFTLPRPLDKVTALRLEVLPDPSLPDDGPGRAPLFSVGDFLLTDFTAMRGGQAQRFVTASEDYAGPGTSAAKAIDGEPDTGWGVKGSVGRPHAAVFVFRDDQPSGATLKLTLRQEYIHQMTIGRFRLSVTDRDRPVAATGLTAESESIVNSVADKLSEDQARRLLRDFLLDAPELAAQRKQLEQLRASLPKPTTSLVMREREPRHARVSHIHQRGEFLRLGEPVEPATPASLHSLPNAARRTRLDLARWLVDRENPLVARVVVNQIWQMYFGRGLVGTVEDFGAKGTPPTHPELLDWLAVEFMDQGWSLKALHRLIVTSATYRQSSQLTPELLARDPRNELLARGSRFRLDAEVIRDLALEASGLLVREIGGPSVYPPQPEGATALAYGMSPWKESQGPARYRRGLYTFTKRTAPYPTFTTFDAPTSEVTCVRRERSNTPLQALTLLNDRVFMEASRALARSVVSDARWACDDDRARRLYRLCLTRGPRIDEVRSLVDFVEQQRAGLADSDADKIVGSMRGDVTNRELAAWIIAARVVLNLDETICKE